MLQILPTQGDDKTGAKALWLDLLNPTSAEVTNVEKTVGATLPTLGALSEIEASSRLRNDHGVLYMSAPSAAVRPAGAQTTPPLGFVLSTDRLITVRFMPLPSFDAVVDKFASSQDVPKSSLEVFTLLCEEIVDHVADILEHLAGELNSLSIDAFRADDTRGRHAARANHVLRVQLRQVGRLGDRFSELRDGLQGLGRIVAYTVCLRVVRGSAQATPGRSPPGHPLADRLRGAIGEQSAVRPGCLGWADRHSSK
jgi:magnesium transporter